MELEKILEWFRKPIGGQTEEAKTEESIQLQNQVQEQTQEQIQEQMQEQVQNQTQEHEPKQATKQALYNFPGADILTPADLHDIAVGRQRFVAKYANFENLNSLLQTIEPVAYRQYLLDIQSGRRQGDYYTYLEKAKDITLEATKTLAEQLRKLQQYSPTFTLTQRQQGKRPYTVRDMMRDYKKSLPYITTKYHMIYHLDDGTVDRGRLDLSTPSGIPKEN